MALLRNPFLQILDTVGDGTGITDMTGVYSAGSPGVFKIVCPANVRYFLSHIHIVVADNANLNMTDYGAIPGGLTNGCQVTYSQNGVVGDFLKGFRPKQNVDWLVLGDTTITTFAGTAQALKCEGLFPQDYNDTFEMNDGDYFQMTWTDDLSTLVHHRCIVWGMVETGF